MHLNSNAMGCKFIVTTFLTDFLAESESDESDRTVDELLLPESWILSFCCLSFDRGVLVFFCFFIEEIKQKQY